MKPTVLFIHGLDSSSKGRKGRYFRDQFPDMIIPDFIGDLSNRMRSLEKICENLENLILIGSSFGGLMATCYAKEYSAKINRLILLAPAFNFEEFSIPPEKLKIPTRIIIGRSDNVTPPAKVIPLAKASFKNLEIKTYDSDHLLREIFEDLDWKKIFGNSLAFCN